MITISDRRNLLIKVYVIGYSNRGESICILFLDAECGNKVLYSIVIDSFKYKGLNKTIDILNQWGINKDKLNMLVWSHPDYDHTYGIDEIIHNFCDENTMVLLPYDLNGEVWNKIKYNRDDRDIVQKILKLTQHKFKSHETACVPEKMFVPFKHLVFNDLIGNLYTTIQAVSPHSNRINYLLESHSEIHKNDLSLCLQIDVGNEYKYTLVFLSDIENDDIETLYPQCYESPVFIKIPHHTSSTSDKYCNMLSSSENKPYIACTTIYKSQKLPEKNLLNEYRNNVRQVDCTGFSKSKKQNYGLVEYTFDFYNDFKITVHHEGHATVVDDTFLDSITYAKKSTT
mgnify:CR=1 FL=1